MPSEARTAFDKNANDIERLLELHGQIGGTNRGRRYGLEVLNKSAIVLITAFWETYCEDIAAEGLEHLVRHAKSSDALPVELKKQVLAEMKDAKHELEYWKIADDGWRTYLNERFEKLREHRNRRLNSPNAKNIDMLFKTTVGIEKISDSWRLARNMPPRKAVEKLDRFVELRGAIAHRGKSYKAVTKAQVRDYFELVSKLAAKTGGEVNSHVKDITSKPLWRNRAQRIRFPE